MYNTMLNYRDELALKIKRDKALLDSFPTGNLKCHRDRKYSKWYLKNPDGSMTYIPKKERERAKQMAEKRLVKLRIDSNQAELEAVKRYLNSSVDTLQKISDLVSPESIYSELLVDEHKSLENQIASWREDSYEKNANYPEQLNKYSPTGNVLRSKTELMIDMYLASKSIPYRYECKLQLRDGSYVFPDFTIMKPNGKEIYWEHCGRMDDPAYVESFLKKIDLYFRNGIYINETLFVTFETSNSMLQVSEMEFVLNKIMR